MKAQVEVKPIKFITSASYSRLLDFETCRFKAYLKHAERVPDPKPSPAADRGTLVHTNCENFVNGKAKDLDPVAAKFFKDELYSLRDHYKAGRVSLEGEWGFDKEWKPCDYKKAWARIKLDANVLLTSKHAVVIDHKTGKKWGNEIKHGEQMQLYTLATVIRYQEIEQVTAELWYLDQNELTSITVTREQALRYLKPYNNRFVKMTSATTYPPNPNAFSCRWCPYKPERLGGTGHCPVGV